MAYQLTTPSFSFLPELRFLVSMCKGPQAAKSSVAEWAELLEAKDPITWSLESLKTVCQSLVTLAHANAAFSREQAPFFYRGRSGIDLEDCGGFLLAKKIVFAILDEAPLCKDCKGELLRYVLRVTTQQMSQIEKLLPQF